MDVINFKDKAFEENKVKFTGDAAEILDKIKAGEYSLKKGLLFISYQTKEDLENGIEQYQCLYFTNNQVELVGHLAQLQHTLLEIDETRPRSYED